MIKYDTYNLNGTDYTMVISDEFWLERDDGLSLFEDLILPESHTYTETTRKIHDPPVDEKEEALKILFGEA